MAIPHSLFSVGDIVRKLRRERRWSIRQLAQQSGIGRGTISALEGGGVYHSETLKAVARALGTTTADVEAAVQAPPPAHEDAAVSAEVLLLARRLLALTPVELSVVQVYLGVCEMHRREREAAPRERELPPLRGRLHIPPPEEDPPSPPVMAR